MHAVSPRSACIGTYAWTTASSQGDLVDHARYLGRDLARQEPEPAHGGGQPLAGPAVQVRPPHRGLHRVGATGEQPGVQAGADVPRAGDAESGAAALVPP